MTAGDYAVVLVCQCSARHKPIYVARWVSKLEAERIAAEFALNNGHNFLVVCSNGLAEARTDHYRPDTFSTTGTNRS